MMGIGGGGGGGGVWSRSGWLFNPWLIKSR